MTTQASKPNGKFDHPVDELAQRLIDENYGTSMSAAYRETARRLYDTINPIAPRRRTNPCPDCVDGLGASIRSFSRRGEREIDEEQIEIDSYRHPSRSSLVLREHWVNRGDRVPRPVRNR